ncbi:DUF5133 domain-containing protein [Streptomyces sp. NBC_00083]|uniref:DUF5133 domain-containing protein n=1 Tax=Streptomyces sp. NBC_00083 TaxID=2975647 RepID=UPI002259A0F9|nr:DUF5133 domain-containing protein [Streptomyces sp. NBC_00083]MCX5384298.1 DUF5133 domain-containing protein [Streptomyces sp. NBC_00083]
MPEPMMLSPHWYVVHELLSLLRSRERRAARAPLDSGARQARDDAAYTLCVLMGERTIAAAVKAAEHYLARSRQAVLPAVAAAPEPAP